MCLYGTSVFPYGYNYMQVWDGVVEFVKVVDCGSFSQAAQHLGVSRSHISKKIKELETRLGVELLKRTTRSVHLTNLGAEFYPKCKHLLIEMAEAQALLIDEAAKPQGIIRVTVAGAFGEQMLAPILAEFANQFPDISVEVEFTNRLINLAEEQFDIALRSGFEEEIVRRNEIAERVYNFDLLTAASPYYLSKYGKPMNTGQLAEHNCLAGTLPHWRFQAENGVENVVVQGRWKSNNGRALVEAAKQGLGIIQVPHFYVENEVADGSLVPLLNHIALRGLGYFAVVPTEHPPRRVSILLDFLKDKLLASS